MLQNFIHLYLKIFLLLTPFFVLSVFLSMTAGMGTAERRRIASKITIAVLVASFVLFFFGHYIFYIFGITSTPSALVPEPFFSFPPLP